MKTTKKDFEIFKNAFNSTCELLGLKEYRITFRHRPLKDAFAQILIDEAGKCATVTLTTIVDRIDLDEYDPRKNGIHEALHLLIHNLEDLARSRYITPYSIDEEVHRIIRRLEKTFKID